MAHESQIRYSKLIDTKLRNELVLQDGVVFNTRYEGDPTAGSVKIPVRDTEVEVKNYDKSKGANLTQGSTTYETMLISEDEAVNELIDGYDAQTVPDNLVADRLDSAGYSLGMSLDSKGAKCLEDSATLFGDTTPLTQDTVYKFFTKARTKHSKLGVPKQGRFAIVTPETYELLLNEPKFLQADKLNENLIRQGVVGQIAGYNIIECTYLSEKTEAMFGHPNWCHRVKDWKVPVAVNDLKGSGNFIGACAVQGRQVHNHKVTKAYTLLRKVNATVEAQLVKGEAPVIGALEVTCTTGAEVGASMLIVNPELTQGNFYKYKSSKQPTLPTLEQVCATGYTVWDGISEITGLVAGNKIIVVEVDAENKAIKTGVATVEVKE